MLGQLVNAAKGEGGEEEEERRGEEGRGEERRGEERRGEERRGEDSREADSRRGVIYKSAAADDITKVKNRNNRDK